MKIIFIISIILFASIKPLEEYSGSHTVVLNDASSTIDGTSLSTTSINGVSYNSGVVSITSSGTYILSGTLNGQVSISVGSTDKVVIVLNGVSIASSSSNGIIFLKAYEIDSSSSFSYSTAKSLSFDDTGAKIIIADGSENSITGTKSSDGDGAIHSVVTLLITGEASSNGVLNVIGTKEGIEVEKHLFINGGVLNIAAQDDGINVKNAYICIVRGGKVLINSGLGSEGDGIDSNGYILIDGGEIISAASPNADTGLDADQETIIDGGNVISVGSSMDMASTQSSQPAMNLIFSSSVSSSSTLTIKDSDGNLITSFCANDADFQSGTSRRSYTAAVVSHTSFTSNSVYHLYLDGTQLGYTGNDSGSSSGPGGQGGPGGHGSSSSSSSSSSTIYTDFTLSSTAKYFSGVQKAL